MDLLYSCNCLNLDGHSLGREIHFNRYKNKKTKRN